MRARPLLLALLTLVATLPAVLAGPSPADAATVAARGSGRWSAPATWGGRLPTAGQTVTIPAGATVLADVSTPDLRGLQVDGTLRFDTRDVTLTAGWVMVHGRLQAGSPTAPHPARATIVLAPRAGDDVHGMGAGVLGVMGGTLDLHGQRKVSWTRLRATAASGSLTLDLPAVSGWRVGDRVALASTSTDPSQAETRTIRRIEPIAGGHRVVVDRPLTHTHWGATSHIGGKPVAQHAEVGNLTRTVVVRSVDTTARGHVAAMKGSTVRVSSVEFADLGQPGKVGRYPLHFHHLGSAAGSSVRGSAIHTSRNRCLTIHGTSDLVVADNVGFNAMGHCFFLEDGVETGNRLDRNLGFLTRVPPAAARLLASDRTPATFWITHPTNHLVGNVAAGSEGDGFWYDLPERPTGLSAGSPIRPRTAPMGTFRDNVAHSNRSPEHVHRHGSGLLVEDYRPPSPATFSGLVSYKNRGFGAWVDDGRITVTGATLSDNEVGFLGRGATLSNSHVVGRTPNRAGALWSMIGVGVYHERADVTGVSFANLSPDEHTPHAVAVGGITDDTVSQARFSKVSFTNSRRVRIAPPWHDGAPQPPLVLRDLDGSLLGTGVPATVTGDNPLVTAAGCRTDASVGGRVCATNLATTRVQLVDQSGDTTPFGAVTYRRGSARSLVMSDPSWSSRPLAKSAVLLGHRYEVELGRRTPRELEVITATDQAGWVELGLPWPHAQLHAYRGWGEWAQPLTRVSSRAALAGGPDRVFLDTATRTVWVRPTTDGRNVWGRHVLCDAVGCGDGTGSRR